MKKSLFFKLWMVCFGFFSQVHTLQSQDSLVRVLDTVIVSSYNLKQKPFWDFEKLNTRKFVGIKTQIWSPHDLTYSPADKRGRTVFAQVPGVFVYDMDGTGNQLNVSMRGLDAHRGWELNQQMDLVPIQSDIFGYPASHFSVPLERVEKIEWSRGTGALSYGPQWGGRLHFISKAPDSTRKIKYEHVSGVGAFQHRHTYQAVHGRINKFRYFVYGLARSRQGFRDIENTSAWGSGVMVQYLPSENNKIEFDWKLSSYEHRLAGPLTDEQFHENPRQATRTRNYYSPTIHIPSLKWIGKWKAWSYEMSHSWILGNRSSVLFDRPANIPDVPHQGKWPSRMVDLDVYRSMTHDIRISRHVQSIGDITWGITLHHNRLSRKQQGISTETFGYHLSNLGWARDLTFHSQQIGSFIQWNTRLSDRLQVQAEARKDQGFSDLSGVIQTFNSSELPFRLLRRYFLLGGHFQYQLPQGTVYGGWAQAYRPVLLKDLIPTSSFDEIDPTIQDSKGYNSELGFRGERSLWQWDISGFALQYNRRVGMIIQKDRFLRTNTGDSFHFGLEWLIKKTNVWNQWKWDVFFSGAYMNATYTQGFSRDGQSIQGNRVESAPTWILRQGLTLHKKSFTLFTSTHYTSGTFADALNTTQANASGTIGWVPGYFLVDMGLRLHLPKLGEWSLQLDNLTNKMYFTKRPTFYPGPGIWPSDGRSWSLVWRGTW